MFPVAQEYRKCDKLESLDWYMLWVASPVYQTCTYPKIDGVHYWIPTKSVITSKGDDCHQTFEPLVEGYVFVGVDKSVRLSDIEKRIKSEVIVKTIRKTRTKWMRTFVASPTLPTKLTSMFFLRDMSGNYQKMTPDEVLRLDSASSESIRSEYVKTFSKGMPIQVSCGPFSGAKGRVESCTDHGIVAYIMFDGRPLRLTVHHKNFAVLGHGN